MHFMKFPTSWVQVAEKPPIPRQKMHLQRKTIKINDYCMPICCDLGSNRWVLLPCASYEMCPQNDSK